MHAAKIAALTSVLSWAICDCAPSANHRSTQEAPPSFSDSDLGPRLEDNGPPGPRLLCNGPQMAPPTGRKRLPKVLNSPGKIECELTECDLHSQVCCKNMYSHRGYCASIEEGCSSNSTWSHCDESWDCPDDGRCCYVPPGDGRFETFLCRKEACRSPEHETCLPDSKCKNGMTCTQRDYQPTSWYCPTTWP